jgi:hypothetical protein
MGKEIPVVSGIDCIRNPLINFGEGNFIQIYFNNLPYFRAGEEKHHELLEKFLNEVNITDFKRDSVYSFVPAVKGNLYELVGAGKITEASIIKKNKSNELLRGYIAIRAGVDYYNLYPSVEHISKILKYFEEPLIFAGSKYMTEERRKDVENNWKDGLEEDLASLI